MNEVDIKAHLIANDQTFCQMDQQHRGYETQLKKLQDKSYLSNEEQLEETVLKKKKLALKDHMQELIHRYQSE
ncbi:MAG: DUF465 domain-containing protein [Acidobacteriota bacterium]|nr:DUF465 domain-containing protein [Acidobacteriota bacterium]